MNQRGSPRRAPSLVHAKHQVQSRAKRKAHVRLTAGSCSPLSQGLLDEALGLGLGVLLAYAEYLGPAPRAYTLSRRTLVLHLNGFWVLDLNLSSAFHAICLHLDLLAPKIYF